jgi:hypothetical protein
MNGFGFIEYEDAMDARDVVPGKFASSSDSDGEADYCPIAFREYHHSTYRVASI